MNRIGITHLFVKNTLLKVNHKLDEVTKYINEQSDFDERVALCWRL